MMQTTLYDNHLSLNAKMVSFAGYLMPISYGEITKEVEAVRTNAGIFDVSHMGLVKLEGIDATKFLNFLITNDVTKLEDGKAIYTVMCNENGGMLDDLICYKQNAESYIICFNASNKDSDFDWFNSHKQDYQVKLTKLFDNYSIIALQGPSSKNLVSSIGFDVSDMKSYSLKIIDSCYIARTGYTGEDGFEFFIENEKVLSFWDKFLELGVVPCGLAARDVLRIEAGFPLYGNELSIDLNPLDTGLKWVTKFDKDFIGREFLLNYEPKYITIRFEVDGGIARTNHELYFEDEEVGRVTSGTFSPTLKKGIALGLLKKEFKDKNIVVKIRNNTHKIKLVRNFLPK